MLVNGRIPSLDGFRTLSIFLVIVSHLVLQGLLPDYLHNVLIKFNYGILGVRIFFVISGLLITYLLLQERAQYGRVSFRAFYIRRVLRILPAFYFYLAVLGLLNSALDLHIPLSQFVSAALFLQNVSPWGSEWLVAHSWSLAVEEQFYLLLPALLWRVQKVNGLTTWIAVISIVGLLRGFHYSYSEVGHLWLASFFTHADFLFTGCFLAFLLFHHYGSLVTQFNRLPAWTVYIAIAAIWFFIRLEFHGAYSKYFTPVSGVVQNVATCFLIAYFIIRRHSLGYRLLNGSAFTFLGKLSYSLYLWQQLFISQSDYWWTQFPQNIPLTFLAAYLSYRLVETPFLRLKDKVKALSAKQHEVTCSANNVYKSLVDGL